MSEECTCCGKKVEFVSLITFKRRKTVTMKNYMLGQRQSTRPSTRANHLEGFDGVCDDCAARVAEVIRTMQASIRPWSGKM